MTVQQVIDRADAVKPNGVAHEEKVNWLSYLDATIFNDLISTHEIKEEDLMPSEFKPYDADEDVDKNLLVTFPYDELYLKYLEMKIDEANGETAKYNNSAIMFNSYFQEYRTQYHRTHLPIANYNMRIG